LLEETWKKVDFVVKVYAKNEALIIDEVDVMF
jgi:hypothetical protein